MSQRGKRGNNHRLESDPQPPPTKRRKGRPPNGSTTIGVVAGATGSKATTLSSTNDNDHPEGGGASGSGSSLSLAPPIPMASAASTSHTISSKMGSGTSSVPWQARSVADIKISSIYNRSSTEAPAELYRKDLISAMKLPDSEPLASNEYLIVTDQWKQEWEKGVQVPVNPDSLPEPSVGVMQHPIVQPAHDFKLPKNRYIRITKDETYTSELHYLTNVVGLAENTCAYDIDQVDEVWLDLLNKQRALGGATPITSEQFERVIEELEIRCWEQIQVLLKNEEGLGIEYDENVICDVCRSPDSEEANEMVFCDKCNICVHQACYGITAIPSGQWLCRTCSMDIKPGCVLCPNKGGAMKSTKSGKNWAHVSCALWIPEVSIGCVDRMEPITKISTIPQSRWALICVLCKERVGACIQCSVKTCKTAYHVTCAFQHGLEMRAIIEEGNAEDGVKLRSYCLKHSMGSKGKKGNQKATNNNGLCSGIDDEDGRRRKSRKDMTSEERNQVRARRLKEVEAEFDKHVNIRDISCHLFECDEDAITSIYNYWKLKRKSHNNNSLIPPKTEDVELIARKQEQVEMENHKLVVHVRQDLERVRNLCYMVSRREKLSRSQFKLREQIFYKQISVLSDDSIRNTQEYDESFTNAVIYANDGSALYDRFYTSSNFQGDNSFLSLEYIKEKLLGAGKGNKVQTSVAITSSSTAAASSTANRKKSISQYKKINVNGAKTTRRNGGGERKADSSGSQSSSTSSSTSGGSSASSGSSTSSASSASSASSVSSASENESAKKKASPTKQRKKQSYLCSVEMRQKRRKASTSASTAAIAASSSSDEEEKKQDSHKRRNNYLSQMEKELEKDSLLSSSNESEELIPLKNLDSTSKNVSHKSTSQIYSDSDSSTSTSEEDKEKTESNVNDYQTNVRTKAAMKEFTLLQSIQKQKKEAAAAKAKEDVSSVRDRDKEKGKEKEKDKAKGKETSKENLRTEVSSKDKKADRSKKSNNQDGAQPKSAEKQKFVTDLLVVPQRQAAKKASENMRSTNIYSSSATTTAAAVVGKKDSRDDRESDRTQAVSSRDKEKEKDRDREKDKPKESSTRLDEKVRSKEKEKEKDKAADKVVGKRGRPPKNTSKNESISISSKDIVSPRREKVQAKSESAKSSSSKSTTESPNSVKPPTDTTKNNMPVSYVPQRQAAKKAAEQLKSGGMVKSSTTEVSAEERDSKDKESKLKSPENNKKQTTESHAAKPRRLSKEVATKDASQKETATKEPALTPRATATRKSKDSAVDVKELESKTSAPTPVPAPAPIPTSAALSASAPAPTAAPLSVPVVHPTSPSPSPEKNKSKEEKDKEGTRRLSVRNVSLTSSSESSSSSSSSCSSSSSDESDVEENRKSTTTRKLTKSNSGEKPTRKSSSLDQTEAPKSPPATELKSPVRSKLPSISHCNDNGSINGTKETAKKEETLPLQPAKSPAIEKEEKAHESAPIVLVDDDDEDDDDRDEEEVVPITKTSPHKEKAEDVTAPQTIEIDDDEATKESPSSSPSPNLEEEIAQRKADLVSSSSTYNNSSTTTSLSTTSKSHRNFGSLDKLLNKKEREISSNSSSVIDEIKSSSSVADGTSNVESETLIEAEREKQREEKRAQKERISTPTIQEKLSRSIRIEDPDIIELDSSSAQSLKIDSNEPHHHPQQQHDEEAQDNSPEKLPQTPPMPSSSEESQKMMEQSPATPAAYPHHHHHHRMSSFDPTAEDQMNLLDNMQEPDDNDDDEDDDDDGTAALTEFSFGQVVDPPDVDCAAQDATADRGVHKEDDSALTMDLVKKLRQSQSQKRNHNKCDDVPADFGPPPTPAIPTTFPYNHHHADDMFQQKENSAPTSQLKDDSLLPDEKSVIEPVVPQLTNNSSSGLTVPFSENAINFPEKSSTNNSSMVQFPSLQSSNDQQQSHHILQDSTAVNDASSMFLTGTGISEKKKTPHQSSMNSSECFNKLADFKQPDFVDLHATKETSMDFTTNAESVSSKLVDCDYDENTRMQSPYMNVPNMWNENDLIQTRRSVSTSPSSVSESNDMPHTLAPCNKSNQQPQQQQQDCTVVVNQKNHFGGAIESFGGSLSSQFNSIAQQNTASQNMVNGIDMLSSSYGFAQQQQQMNHSQNQYNGPVSLFHAPPPHANMQNHMNQTLFPTPGAVLFPSAGLAGNVPLSASQSQQQSQQQQQQQQQQQNTSIFGGNHQNHRQEASPSPFMSAMSTGNGGSGGAAFTSSSHNLALTAAIVSTPGATLDHHHSPQNLQFNAASAQFNSLLELMPPTSSIDIKESPSKRTSARFSQQQPPPRKSPQMHKSPGKSPRQMELLSKQMSGKNNSAKFDGQTTGRQRKNLTRGTGTGRGRGRGRGRGGRLASASQIPPVIEYGNTHIVNNLVGTPYEFNYEEDMASSNVENLQSLRDRRRSFDCRGNMQQNTTPEQQKFSSPSYTCKMRSSTQTTASNNCNNRQGDLKTPTSSTIVNTSSEYSMVRPVLPGPVDMRTYSLDFEAQHSSASQEAYNNNLLGAFDSGTADQTLPDIDEEVEKEFQSALKASGTGIRHTQNNQPANAPEVVMPAELQTSMETTSEEISIDSDTTNTKVSLSDSRNQLKLKIKGPLSYPDTYNSSSLSVVQQSSVQVSVSQVAIGGGNSTVSGGGGTSGIRRMRKKELLQYWGQKETNLDDTVGLPQSAEKQASSLNTMISRSVGIPKAVDSMLSIPTKDDYKGYNSTETTSKRKKFGSRELRQLDMSYDVTEGNPERRRSGCSTGSNLSVSNETGGKTTGKRRGRSKTLESEEEQTPKLKIKIRKKSYESTSTTASGGSAGNSGVAASTNVRIVSCPPKKRLTSNYAIPSFELLRRESMNYRKKVMADFGDDDEEKPNVSADNLDAQPHTSRKKSSKQKKEKKRKKQDKHIQVIENNASDAGPKLIIRFGKRKVEGEAAADESFIKASAEAALQMVPLRLKLARNSDGGGYVIGNNQQSADQQQDHSDDKALDRLSGETPKETDTAKINQPVPPLKLRTNFHNEQSAININAGYSNSSNSCSTPPSALPPLASDTAKTEAAASMAAPTDTSMAKSLSTTAATNDCSLLPLNKDCEVR